jgi:hypothetical protein
MREFQACGTTINLSLKGTFAGVRATKTFRRALYRDAAKTKGSGAAAPLFQLIADN